jgi:hypothetical protein
VDREVMNSLAGGRTTQAFFHAAGVLLVPVQQLLTRAIREPFAPFGEQCWMLFRPIQVDEQACHLTFNEPQAGLLQKGASQCCGTSIKAAVGTEDFLGISGRKHSSITRWDSERSVFTSHE